MSGYYFFVVVNCVYNSTIYVEFKGSHPKVVQNWLPKEDGVYKVSESYNASLKQKKHQLMIKIENILGLDLSKKHYKLLKWKFLSRLQHGLVMQ